MSEGEGRALIRQLELAPHPEGGWYRETWRAPTPDGGRAAGTAILFLLEAGGRSHWHRVDADELWLWHAGHPIELAVAATGASPVLTDVLGPDVATGALPQRLVPKGNWQAAHARAGWALVSCVVVPGFEFAGFTLASPGWTPAEA